MNTDTDENVEQSKPRLSLKAWLVATSVGLLLATGSITVYMKLGHPTALEVIPSRHLETGMTSVHQDAGDISVLLEGLKDKLHQNPENGPGWALLARSYVELKRHPEALPAFAEAMKRIPDDAQLLVDYADALGVAHGGALNHMAAGLIEKAIQLDPQNTKALLLAATVAYDRKDYGSAVRYWETVLGQEGLEPVLAQKVKANIAEVNEISPGGVIPVKFTSPKQLPVVGPRIQGQVRVASELSNKIAETDTVFIFAKPVTGHTPPVAVLQVSNRQWPYSFELNDSHQVMQGRKLSDAGEVIIVARISKSGDAMPHSGDLEGKSRSVQAGDEAVEVVIDTQLP